MNNADTSTVSEAYAKMLTIFIPLLVDEVFALIDNFSSLSLSEDMSSSQINMFIALIAEFILCTLYVL